MAAAWVRVLPLDEIADEIARTLDFLAASARDLPAGIYEGNVRVAADGEVRRVPLQLELFDFTLPVENSMHAMVYYESLQPELYQGRNLDEVYHRFAHRQDRLPR